MKGNDIVRRFNALVSTRRTLDSVLQDIEEYVVPYRGEFYQGMTSEGEVDWNRANIFDNTAGVGVDQLASQMHGNVTSSVTKWFRLRFRDEDMNTDQAAKEWLEDAEDKTYQAIQQSNFDTTAPEMYLDIAAFGTSLVTMEDKNDLKWDGVTFNALPLMDSYFEMGPDDIPYRVYRLLRYTQMELEDTFDLPRKLKERKKEDTSVDIKHEVIFCIYREPENATEVTDKLLAPDMRPTQWRYVDKRTGIELKLHGQKKAEGGYYDFPAMVVRWKKVAGSRWGYSPVMVLIAEIKQLNLLVEMTTEAAAKEIDPPLKTTDRGIVSDLDNVAGGLTVVSEMDELQPLLPHSNFTVAQMEYQRAHDQINAGLYVDRLDLPNARAMTATEVQIRYDRILRLLAVTMGRLKVDFLDPVVEGVFNKLLRAGQLDELPESLSQADLDIEYTGPLPRALKGEVADGMERWLMGVMQQVELNPDSLDIVDFDQFNRTMAEQRGTPAKCLNTDDEVKEVRAERQVQQQQMQEAQQVQMGGEAAKAAGEGAQALQAAGVEQ